MHITRGTPPSQLNPNSPQSTQFIPIAGSSSEIYKPYGLFPGRPDPRKNSIVFLKCPQNYKPAGWSAHNLGLPKYYFLLFALKPYSQ